MFSETSAMSKNTGNVYNSNTRTLVSHLIASEIPFCKQRTPCAILSSDWVTGKISPQLWWQVIQVRSFIRNKAGVVWNITRILKHARITFLLSLPCSNVCWPHIFIKIFPQKSNPKLSILSDKFIHRWKLTFSTTRCLQLELIPLMEAGAWVLV